MTGSDRSAYRLQATDLSRFLRPVEGQHPSLIGAPIRTLIWQLIDGQHQAVAAELTSESAIEVTYLLYGLAEYGIWLDPNGRYELSQQREFQLCAEIGRMMLPGLQTASRPRAEIPELSESECADLTVDMIEARLYGRTLTSPLAVRVRAAMEETYGSLTDGMADWLEDIALAQWSWRQISTGVEPSDLTRVLARSSAAPEDEQLRGIPEVQAELRRIAGPPDHAPVKDAELPDRTPAEDADLPF